MPWIPILLGIGSDRVCGNVVVNGNVVVGGQLGGGWREELSMQNIIVHKEAKLNWHVIVT
ncbi:hypothetical protein AKJ16_DCAP12493 [Drosera capensis]